MKKRLQLLLFSFVVAFGLTACVEYDDNDYDDDDRYEDRYEDDDDDDYERDDD
ncbi:MAG: hypothetical protein ACQEUT_18045 [Bacillota bacterium]